MQRILSSPPCCLLVAAGAIIDSWIAQAAVLVVLLLWKEVRMCLHWLAAVSSLYIASRHQACKLKLVVGRTRVDADGNQNQGVN